MQTEQPKPWTLYVHAKARNFYFKLKAKRMFTNSKNLCQYSIIFKLSPLQIKLESHSPVSFLKKLKPLKSGCIRILKKLRIKPTKNRVIGARKNSFTRRSGYEGPNCENFAMLCNSIAEKDIKGIIMPSLIIIDYLFSQVNKFLGRKFMCLLMILSVVMVGYLFAAALIQKQIIWVVI